MYTDDNNLHLVKMLLHKLDEEERETCKITNCEISICDIRVNNYYKRFISMYFRPYIVFSPYYIYNCIGLKFSSIIQVQARLHN